MVGSGLCNPVQAGLAQGLPDWVAVAVKVLRPSVLKLWADNAVARSLRDSPQLQIVSVRRCHRHAIEVGVLEDPSRDCMLQERCIHS